MDLKAQSNKDLEKLALEITEERNRRAELVRQERIAKCQEWAKSLTSESVNLLAPKHTRTSCDDSNVEMNGFSEYKNYYRCVRCFLLQIVKSGGYYFDPPFTMEVSFHFDPIPSP